MAKDFDYDSFPWGEHFKLDKNSPSGLAWNRVTNTSGVVGVGWQGSNSNNTRAFAHWIEYENGIKRQKSKSFAVNSYGLLPAFSEAVKYRKQIIEELNRQGYGYTENHGQ